MQLTLLPKAVSALRCGRIGDAGVLKAVALSLASYPDVEAAVSRLQTPLPDLVALSEVTRPAPGTLGAKYIDFVRRYQITPLRASAELPSSLDCRNLVAARYVLVHDAFHVLLGFDVFRCGELAVWSFVEAQRYNQAYSVAAVVASKLYPLLEPGSRRQLALHREEGLRLGAQVPCLIAPPTESLWTTPLLHVRKTLGIPERVAGSFT